MVQQAFVLGAGLGTRLKMLTQHRPKPLIPVANRPLISYAFDHLLGVGVQKFVVNTHWRAEVYDEVFPEALYRGTPITFRHEAPEVLETGGGIKNVEDVLRGAPFWVYNGDILSTIPLEAALRAHRDARNEVTLVLRSSGGPLQVACDAKSGRVTDIGARVANRPGEFLFTGIYLVEPEFFARIAPATKISVVPIFCEMIRGGAKLGGAIIDDGDWFDLGTREQYLAVHEAFARDPKRGSAPWIHPSARVGDGARITGASAVGENAIIGSGAVVHDSIVWPAGEVAPGAQIERCIIAGGHRAEGPLHDVDVA